MKRYVHNPTGGTIFAGGVMIPPGEGREVDETYLPPAEGAEPTAEPEAPDPDANLRDLLKHPVKDVIAQLPGFSAETLQRLHDLEAAHDKPRTTLLAAVAGLQLERAKAATGGG